MVVILKIIVTIVTTTTTTITIIIIIPETRKYWVDVQQGTVSSHGERDPL